MAHARPFKGFNCLTWFFLAHNDSPLVKSVDFMQNENPGYLIGSYAFYDCSLVGDLVIPDSFTGIRKNSFTKSYGINDIYINLPVESIFGTTSTNSPVNPFYDGPVGKTLKSRIMNSAVLVGCK